MLWIAVVFGVGDRAEWNLVEWGAGLSTERAQEMQKSSCQWLVVSGRFEFRVSSFGEVT